ncbi:asparagine synthase (glutamine-hydrolysing) [Antricoccus suffuscus]|uniref:asparagine synthase (glutamine-hydrolyzing) n=1 Tax=Antricoccus suffuscus TaxID=1629062 RepID=A0A2T0ZXR2_9ACTN|nr:asparagine synthase-related protein [Antricoccus suffuscus]PRZ41140.1 asparagine synthase (glutamine-hydrolysing) [Antricoccus suffuscus]
MCGIALIVGETRDHTSDLAVFGQMMETIAARGTVSESVSRPGLLAGTRRLPIVDRERAVQPWIFDDGRWLLCYNGEIYNYRPLLAELGALGRTFRSESDTEVIAEAFSEWGEHAVDRLRGEYAFAAVEPASGRTYLARDAIGVKPLYFARANDQWHVASEIKALAGLGATVFEVEPGHHGWLTPDGKSDLTPHVDLARLGHSAPPIVDVHEATAAVRAAISDAISVRIDSDLTIGVILSGGLDSSIVLKHVVDQHPDCVAFTIGTAQSEDLAYARRLTTELGVRHEVIEIKPRSIRYPQIREAIEASELTEYGDIINAAVSIPLFRRIHECGIKIAIGGDGSDELFGGYPMYANIDSEQQHRLFLHKIANLGRTELQRVDRTSMSNGVEMRVPFLDPAVVELAMRIPGAFKVRDGVEKWIVRQAFRDDLPDYVISRPKHGLSYSTGLHDRARLFKPLFPRVYRSFGYDLHAPLRRDFDTVLSSAGYDLDRAATREHALRDYSPVERAKDFAGAVRWNVQPPLERLLSGARNTLTGSRPDRA